VRLPVSPPRHVPCSLVAYRIICTRKICSGILKPGPIAARSVQDAHLRDPTSISISTSTGAWNWTRIEKNPPRLQFEPGTFGANTFSPRLYMNRSGEWNPMDGSMAITMVPDEDLVFRFRAGEEEAFSQLYARYRRRVFATAYRIMRNPEDAQDAAQEIFLKIYRRLPEWNSDRSSLSTWLYRLAANHAIDMWRVKNRRSRYETATENADTSVARIPDESIRTSPSLALEWKEQRATVSSWAESLPRLQKRLFCLRYFLGLSLEEIAAAEKRSIGTVKGLLFRATHSIRDKARRTPAGGSEHKTTNSAGVACRFAGATDW
jgi:RNA polymerase sigma factor (sigma-70 family)